MHVTLCDFIDQWDAMTATQKKNLIQRYESSCDCKVERIQVLTVHVKVLTSK